MPAAVQSASVPSCSSAVEDCELPPRPTQKAAAVGRPLVSAGPQRAAGCTQVPEAAENEAEAPPKATTGEEAT